MLKPYSVSVEKAGFRLAFPATFLTGVPATTSYVSYCARYGGRRPAVPCETRSLNSSTPGIAKSSETRQAPEIRWYVEVRSFEPNNDDWSRRTRPSRI